MKTFCSTKIISVSLFFCSIVIQAQTTDAKPFLQTDRNSKMEILSVSDKSVKAKMTVYGETNIKALADLNVTIEEYASFYGKYLETLADYLGLEYMQKFEDGWIVFSVTEKK